MKIADAALNWLDAHYSMQEKGNFHPTLAPWHTFAIAAQYQLNGASPHLETLFSMSDQLIHLQSEPEFPGRFFTEKGPEFRKP